RRPTRSSRTSAPTSTSGTTDPFHRFLGISGKPRHRSARARGLSPFCQISSPGALLVKNPSPSRACPPFPQKNPLLLPLRHLIPVLPILRAFPPRFLGNRHHWRFFYEIQLRKSAPAKRHPHRLPGRLPEEHHPRPGGSPAGGPGKRGCLPHR